MKTENTAQIHYTLEASLATTIKASVGTIGFFDGVHRGHRALLTEVVRIARATERQAVVVTFARHPRLVLDPTFAPALLLSDEERIARLATTGVDHVVVLDFDAKMAGLTAREFMQSVLCDTLAMCHLLIGHDHRFGRNRSEHFEDYKTYGQAMQMEVTQITPYIWEGQTPSSSLIRSLLSDGKVAEANALLDYHYTLSGMVVKGRQIGRTIGFPTANVQVQDALRLVPAPGVYVVRTNRGDGVMNIGNRPTFTDQPTWRTIEVHLLDTSADLYDTKLEVALLAYLRTEQRFENIEALRRQIAQDCTKARTLLATYN